MSVGALAPALFFFRPTSIVAENLREIVCVATLNGCEVRVKAFPLRQSERGCADPRPKACAPVEHDGLALVERPGEPERLRNGGRLEAEQLALAAPAAACGPHLAPDPQVRECGNVPLDTEALSRARVCDLVPALGQGGDGEKSSAGLGEVDLVSSLEASVEEQGVGPAGRVLWRPRRTVGFG